MSNVGGSRLILALFAFLRHILRGLQSDTEKRSMQIFSQVKINVRYRLNNLPTILFSAIKAQLKYHRQYLFQPEDPVCSNRIKHLHNQQASFTFCQQ